MRSGELNVLVVFEEVTQEQDDVLNISAKWGEYAKAWCSALIAPGGEEAATKQTTSGNVWTLKTHWSQELAGVTVKMRARLADGRTLGIRSVVNDQMQNRELIVTCEEFA